jgi:hypothetical protein
MKLLSLVTATCVIALAADNKEVARISVES